MRVANSGGSWESWHSVFHPAPHRPLVQASTWVINTITSSYQCPDSSYSFSVYQQLRLFFALLYTGTFCRKSSYKNIREPSFKALSMAITITGLKFGNRWILVFDGFHNSCIKLCTYLERGKTMRQRDIDTSFNTLVR